jgi:hypothetical protein
MVLLAANENGNGKLPFSLLRMEAENGSLFSLVVKREMVMG